MTDVQEPLFSVPWSRGTSTDMKFRVATNLRDDIEAHKDVAYMILKIENELGQDAKKVMVEAIQAKSVADGRNLLMHAAACGSKHGFVTLVDFILGRKYLGYTALVRQLRELDEDGAPLLFQAVLSNSVRCFKTVLGIVKETLGMAGLDEQLYAIDHKGRNILMYAVRSPSISVYNKIREFLEGNMVRVRPLLLSRFDVVGRSLLHHAAESDCPDILQKVVKQAKEHSLFGKLSRADHKGRTPVMYVLRDYYRVRKRRFLHRSTPIDPKRPSLVRSSSEKLYSGWRNEDLCRAERHGRKLDILLDEMDSVEQLRSLTQPPLVKSGERCESTLDCWEMPEDGLTALMHAARGGRLAFDLAVMKIDSLLGDSTNRPYSELVGLQFLDAALGIDGMDKTNSIRDLRRGMLLEEAAAGGNLDVLQHVAFEIAREEPPDPETPSSTNHGESDSPALLRALESINRRGKPLLTMAIKSCNTRMVKWIAELINHHYRDSTEAWDRLRGHMGEKSSLACAASTPTTAKRSGQEMFDTVLRCLRQAAGNMHRYMPLRDINSNLTKTIYVNGLLRDELVVPRESRRRGKTSRVSPLGGAVLQSNRCLFRRVYNTYKQCGGRWTRQQILDQLREATVDCRDFSETSSMIANDGGIMVNVPAQMWHTIAKAFEGAYGGDTSWVKWRECFSRTVQALAEEGDLAQMRALVKEKFPLHAHIPVLLERIGDHEENIIETIVLVLVHASNPLVVWAGASRDIIKAEVDFPMYKAGLRRLRDRLDALVIELLEHLPRTVRGVGRELCGSLEPSELSSSHAHGDLQQQRNRERTVGLLGFVVVRWILEPSLTSDFLKDSTNDGSNDILDPLQHALDRGSSCLAFVNSALVLDYLHLKFWNTVPSWTSRNPFHDTIRTAFYSYAQPSEESWLQSGAGELLRFLQGWDKAGEMSGPTELITAFPHSTLLPGLQFTLGGIVGNPVNFFMVPAVRFIFELMSYIAMLGLFGASASIQKSDQIPRQEWIFYFFVLGLFWREILEFEQALSSRPDVVQSSAREDPERSSGPRRGCCLPRHKGKCVRRGHRVAAAIYRYLFYDQWNILDTLTIVVVGAAFVFRMLALGEGWLAHGDSSFEEGVPSPDSDSFFMAQLCLSLSAPLLFSRVLFLSQIDGTLGPMTQVIWVMMAHLARFTVFLLVVMASFALAFHTLFFTCRGIEPTLDEAYGTFWRSLLTMFESMLGNFDFDILSSAGMCHRPSWAYNTGVLLLMGYLVIMSILLLNLLIAVMSTAHSTVDAHAEEEFHLARAKLILQTSRAVAKARLPPPFNITGAAMGWVVDIPHTTWLLCYAVGMFKEYHPTEPLPASDSIMSSIAYDDLERGQVVSWKAAETKGETKVGTSRRISAKETKWEGFPRGGIKTTALFGRASKVLPAQGSATNRTGDALTQQFDQLNCVECVPVEEITANEPFTGSYFWLTMQGGRDRLIFAFTMGLAAVVVSAVLWIISTPWIAWRILRWLFPGGSSKERGYTWTAGSAVVKFFAWLLMSVAALVYCCGCALACAVLWMWGVCSVFEWIHWRLTDGHNRYTERKRRSVMPGEERSEDWSKAREIAMARNYTQNSTGSEQFNVGPLLKMTTGMDVEQLALHIKLKEESDRMMDYVADKLKDYIAPSLAKETTPRTLDLRSAGGMSFTARSISSLSGWETSGIHYKTI